MVSSIRSSIIVTVFFSLLSFLLTCSLCYGYDVTVPESDVDLLEFPLNLEYLEAEFFLYGATGYGLDRFEPNLTKGGPPPYGARLAMLDHVTREIVLQFALQEVGHLRVIQSTVRGFLRPLLDLSTEAFATIMNKAFERPLFPPFDPYENSINYLLASYVIPYVGLTGYVGTNPKLQGTYSKKVIGGQVLRPFSLKMEGN